MACLSGVEDMNFQTGSMVPTNTVCIEMGTQQLANKAKEHGKQKRRDWDLQTSSEIVKLF